MNATVDTLPDSGTITSVKVVQRDPNLRSVHVDGKRIATIRAIDVQTIGLHEGDPWTSSLADRLAHFSEVDTARRRALQMLGARAYSHAELRKRLIDKGHDDGAADEVLSELKSHGWIDDAAMARDMIEEILQHAPAGEILLHKKLCDRMIAEDVITDAMRESLSQHDNRDHPSDALAFAKQRLARLGELEPSAAARRIAGVLARRGFDEDTVTNIIGTLFPDLGWEELSS